MSVNPTNFFTRWEVKPIWEIKYPSKFAGLSPTDFIEIFGVDRGSLDVSHNWEKINSVERFNQGWKAKPTDFTITIAVKERGRGFEWLRRLSMGKRMFDISCSLWRRENTDAENDFDNSLDLPATPAGDNGMDTWVQWLDGFEKYVGCVVNREGQTIEIGEIPVREFEIVFLERDIEGSENFNENLISQGSSPPITDDELGI